MDLKFFVKYIRGGDAEYACSLADARRLGDAAGCAYRVFEKQRGKWHKVYDSEHGY